MVNRSKAPIDLDYTQDETKGIKIELKQLVHEQEVYALCKSKQKEAKETSMRKRVEDLFLERLEYYKAELSIPHRTKKYNKVIELIGRLKEKYSGAAKLYMVEVIPKDKPATNPDLLTKKNHLEEKEKLIRKRNRQEGSCLLRTDRFNLSNALDMEDTRNAESNRKRL